MSDATERLRAMLDERGVEWTEPNNMARSHTTYWTAGFLRCGAVEFNDGMVSIASSSDDITPEQAIEATLGRGECRVVCSREYIECKVDFFECSECGWSGAIDDMKALCEYPRYCPNCGRKVRA